MITIQTLKNISTDELLDVFNLSFSDYLVPLQLTREQLSQKLYSENFNAEYSVGAFENGNLIGFIMHCFKVVNNNTYLYNGGTGVIPAKRGKGITGRMYDYILPVLQSENIHSITLEVMENNLPAIMVYERTGFKRRRQLNCFKGKIYPIKNETDIREIKPPDWSCLSEFWDFHPTWQNSTAVMEKLAETNVFLGAFMDNQLAGYVIYNPGSKRVSQFGVDKKYRNQSVGKALFHHLAENHSELLSVINIDSSSEPTVQFLKNLGLDNHVNQIEMELKLK